MPLFRQSLLKKSTPKTATLPELYKKVSKAKDFSSNDKSQITKVLRASGYDDSTVSKMINGKDLEISKIKEITGHLTKAGVRGFAKKDANRLVNEYVHGEAIKRKNITDRRREFMMEALKEDFEDKSSGDKLKTGLTNSRPKGGGVKLGF